MILEAKAKYDAAVDRVDVVLVVQHDSGLSATASLASGSVELLQGTETSTRIDFDRRSAQLNELDDGVGLEDVGQFYCFVLHPRAQQSMRARCTCTLVDGSTATLLVPVEYVKSKSRAPTQNPALAGRATAEYPMDPEAP
jgi:hypothetical protein